jgi:DUF2075 family protein
MPQKRHLTIPGEIHNVMSRGIDGMDLFRDDTDRERFVSLQQRDEEKAFQKMKQQMQACRIVSFS